MRRECCERFPRHWLQRKPLVSDPGMHHGTCVAHVSWCMSGSLTHVGRENTPSIPGACATRIFTYLVRGPCPSNKHIRQSDVYLISDRQLLILKEVPRHHSCGLRYQKIETFTYFIGKFTMMVAHTRAKGSISCFLISKRWHCIVLQIQEGQHQRICVTATS